MKKLLIIPIFLFAINSFAQVTVLSPNGGIKTIDTSKTLSILGTFIKTPSDTSLYFDSTKVITSVIKNATQDSFQFKNGAGSIIATLKDSIGTITLPTLSTLTDAATITWNYSTQSTEAKVTLGGNRTLSITNLPSGKVVYLTLGVIQDATGSRTLTLPASTKVINGGSGAVSLTATAGATDILSFRWNGTTLYCTYGKNYN